MSKIAQLKLSLSENKNQLSYCSACNEAMNSAHILICAECLNDECQKFSDLFEDNLESSYEIEYSREK